MPDEITTRYRVRIVIYDEQQGHEEPAVFTDEPLYVGSPAEEMAVQAHRTHRHFLQELVQNQ